jgi:hypothetical protein
MKNLSLLAVVLGLFSLLPATAENTKSKQKQVQSSTNLSLNAKSFLGISFDQPFPGDIPPCPKMDKIGVMDHKATKELGELCHFQIAPDKYEIWNGPDLGLGHGVKVLTFQGKPISFYLTVGRIRFDDMAEIFKSKYGFPQQSHTEPMRNAAGAEFNSKVMAWESANMRIELTEIGRDMRWSHATIQNVRLDKIRNAKRSDRATEAAGEL